MWSLLKWQISFYIFKTWPTQCVLQTFMSNNSNNHRKMFINMAYFIYVPYVESYMYSNFTHDGTNKWEAKCTVSWRPRNSFLVSYSEFDKICNKQVYNKTNLIPNFFISLRIILWMSHSHLGLEIWMFRMASVSFRGSLDLGSVIWSFDIPKLWLNKMHRW